MSDMQHKETSIKFFSDSFLNENEIPVFTWESVCIAFAKGCLLKLFDLSPDRRLHKLTTFSYAQAVDDHDNVVYAKTINSLIHQGQTIKAFRKQTPKEPPRHLFRLPPRLRESHREWVSMSRTN